MALQKTAQTSFGINVVDAYHRVEGLRILGKDLLAFQVRSYKDNSGLPHFADQTMGCVYDIEGANPIKQAYLYVKSLDEFAGATDC
jgi:hypothetical protein